jgi:DNA-binding transcriptional MocR family regulator
MIQDDSSSADLLYEKVAGKISKLIRDGVLRPGDRIPSVRRASQQHRVSVTTAVQAYLALENRGLIEARPKSGFYVRYRRREELAEPRLSKSAGRAAPVEMTDLVTRFFETAARPGIVPLGAALPGEELLPVVKLNRLLASLTRTSGGRAAFYDIPPGCEALRREVARRSLDFGSAIDMNEIVTTCGATEALVLCLRAVSKPGDVIAVESPTYYGFLKTIEGLGLKALEISTHPREGLDLDALETALRKHKIAAVLCMPSFNNPLGSLMNDENRRRLVEILAKREIPMIEDDIYGDLHFDEQRPRVARAYDREGLVMLCGSFSKTLAPGYRVGWCAPGRFLSRVKTLKFTNTIATATLPQLAIAEFLRNGGYDHHLRTLRRTYAEQVQQFSEAIAESFPTDTKLTRPRGGFVLWIELPAKVDALALHEQALREGISIAPGPLFSATQQFRNFIRVSCGYPWSGKIERAIGVLGYLVKKATG